MRLEQAGRVGRAVECGLGVGPKVEYVLEAVWVELGAVWCVRQDIYSGGV